MTYIIEYAVSRNSKCRGHGGFIPKGELRIRQKFQFISGNSQQWTCWGCTTPATLAKIRNQIENGVNPEGIDGLSQSDRKRVLAAVSAGAIPEEDVYTPEPSSSSKTDDGGSQKKRAKRPATRSADVEEGDESERGKKGDEFPRSVVDRMPPHFEPLSVPLTGPDSDTPVAKKRRLTCGVPYFLVRDKPEYLEPPSMEATRKAQNDDDATSSNGSPSPLFPAFGESHPLNFGFDPTRGFQSFATPWLAPMPPPPYFYNTGVLPMSMPMPTTPTPISNSTVCPDAPARQKVMSGTYHRPGTHQHEHGAGGAGAEPSSPILVRRLPSSPSLSLSPSPVPSSNGLAIETSRVRPIRIPPPPPKLSLSKFCKSYDLSTSLQKKLEGLKIPGPHVLRRITDQTLSSESNGRWKLVVGEVAELRDAEERWLASLAGARDDADA